MAFWKDGEKRTLLCLVLSLPALVVSFLHIIPFSIDAAWVAVLLCGLPIVWSASVGLVTRGDVKADVLVSLALAASIVIGEIFAAGEVAFIMLLGSYLEDRTVAKARAGLEKLVRLTPVTARVVRRDGEHIVPAAEVKVGDTLRVLAGETVAVDGVITWGQTSVDQSVMTGESLPVDKSTGDAVQSGTVNQFGTFDMTAQKVGEDSSLQRMIRLVASADAGRARIVGLADRWATWIVAAALIAAAVVWPVTGEAIRAVTILVVFCPCALVLATPTAIMAGIGHATRRGILISQGDALERLAGVKRIAFDKTGTLTYGKPAVIRVRSCRPDLDEIALLSLTASAELRSEHPLGKAVVAHWRRVCDRAPIEPDFFRLIPGRGVTAEIRGQTVYAGGENWLAERGLTLPAPFVRETERAKADGATVIYVTAERETLGFLVLSDTLRPDAADTVGALRAAGADVVLLTGDAPQAAAHIAGLAGIAEVRADCLPEDKLTVIRQYQTRGEPVCMVGDGVNDAPALKAAHVGIAMGGVGSDIALEAADIALVRDDIKEIPELLRLSKRVMRTIYVNLALAMLLNFTAVALAAAGLLNPVTGALVHNAGSVAVVIHSSLLLTRRR
ncbi:MAG: cation-translocating P-type ATPase [Oscillospiraceae bacterium]|nr:cation-translocating P-type ATPase [Oscillospiraceae bacterium]